MFQLFESLATTETELNLNFSVNYYYIIFAQNIEVERYKR